MTMSFDTLEARLGELAASLHLDPEDTLVDDVLTAIGNTSTSPQQRPLRRRPLVVAGLLAAAALLIVFTLPAPRRTVANWFGLGSTRIESPPLTAPTPATFPELLDFGRATTAADATARTSLPVPLVALLGEPLGIFVDSPPASGQIIVVYEPSARLPPSSVAGVGALVAAMPGTISEGSFFKIESAGTTVETLTFASASGREVDAVWLSGDAHTYLFADRDDEIVFDSLRLATNTLLWQDGDVTYRLEANISRAEAIELAASVSSG